MLPVAALSENVQLAIVAGVFGAVNLLLNSVILHRARKINAKTDDVHSIVDRRTELLSPPDGEYKREDDV